ncbi:hypothetical protein B0E51_06420 [Rhodanobacter sp. C05]|nr:hypothetical protein B0E51_06420 [Rhodanobacter sp. C05]
MTLFHLTSLLRLIHDPIHGSSSRFFRGALSRRFITSMVSLCQRVSSVALLIDWFTTRFITTGQL